jgi:signal transduction histidine kinase
VTQLRRLRWTAILAAIAFILLVDYARELLFPYLMRWEGRLIMDVLILTGALFFLGVVFNLFERMQNRLELQNRELLMLHNSTLSIYGELALEMVLQKVVDEARILMKARYGAISVVDSQHRIESFVTSGITPEQRERIGPPPVGHGLLGVVLNEGQRLRLPDLHKDPRSVGFPPHHPPMSSLLAVPIVCKGPYRGNLYLAEKIEAEEFSVEDEETLVRFATVAANAIDSAHLHSQLNALAVSQERLRIAHEMHDGLAQVLAYVNTKAQAVKELLRTGRNEDATKHLDQLAGAAREIYTDVRESIIGLRTAAGDRPLAETLQEYVTIWSQQQSLACAVSVDGEPKLSPTAELQVLRIVQEALANVRKHANARRVEVRLGRTGDTWVLSIVDDGDGFNPSELGRSDLPRFGLATLRERAESIGGKVNLVSSPGQGTRIRVELPAPAARPSPSQGGETRR